MRQPRPRRHPSETETALHPIRQIFWAFVFITLPAPGIASTCTTSRPNWDGTQASAVTEAVALFTSPAGLILLALSVLALRFRNQWLGLGAVILWTAFITIVAMIDPSGLRAPGMAEGCIGSPALFIAAAAAICVAIVFRTKPPERGANGSEN